MKKKAVLILASIILVAALFPILVLPTPVSAGGVVQNQGFETGAWAPWVPGGAASLVSAHPNSGNWHARITGATGAGTITQNISNIPAGTWTFAVHMCSHTGDSTVQTNLTLYEAGTANVIYNKDFFNTGIVGYVARGDVFRIDMNADVVITLQVQAGVATSLSDFDDIGLVGSCFIATAAYGSPLDPHIQILREFRDQYLLTNPVGERLVSLYYEYSPPAADFIANHDSLRAVVRVGLLPLVGISAFFVKTTLLHKLVTVSVLLFAFSALMVWRRRKRIWLT